MLGAADLIATCLLFFNLGGKFWYNTKGHKKKDIFKFGLNVVFIHTRVNKYGNFFGYAGLAGSSRTILHPAIEAQPLKGDFDSWQQRS